MFGSAKSRKFFTTLNQKGRSFQLLVREPRFFVDNVFILGSRTDSAGRSHAAHCRLPPPDGRSGAGGGRPGRGGGAGEGAGAGRRGGTRTAGPEAPGRPQEADIKDRKGGSR